MQNLHFPVILGIEDESLIITQRVTFHHLTNNLRQALTPFTHVRGTGTDIEYPC